jgi:hypothetical protein
MPMMSQKASAMNSGDCRRRLCQERIKIMVYDDGEQLAKSMAIGKISYET